MLSALAGTFELVQRLNILLLLTSACTQLALGRLLSSLSFAKLNSSLCIRAEYTELHSGVFSPVGCGARCLSNQRCQAFSTAAGVCQLFVFDKCSKNVRDCSCSTQGQVFVMQQSGLESGALCPSGYGDDLCGTKYKLYSNMKYWQSGQQKCQNENGLVIMADVVDTAEMNQVEAIYSKYGKGMWLGGFQPPGSPEPAGGFYWTGCNLTVDSTLWASGEPNDYHAKENVICRSSYSSHLADFYELAADYPSEFGYVPSSVLCECVSPFD